MPPLPLHCPAVLALILMSSPLVSPRRLELFLRSPRSRLRPPSHRGFALRFPHCFLSLRPGAQFVSRLTPPAVTRKRKRRGLRPEDFRVRSLLCPNAPGVRQVRLR
ncbi:hypothetical protein NDU88_002437 [Pleurodeles waltl]|uniref:Secreted protein n=1 Tax=Pleurodeles waltl TaxID=8319 RepID=A0AAV7RFR7_PLEWA|nr:hypothetical protein NDU88_002437 [Pleurodeles waltl]